MVHIKRLQEDGADILVPIGEIDASSSIELDLTIAKSVGEGFTKILVDCSALEYISSAGLGVFMSYIEEFDDKNIKMALFGMNDKVINTFEDKMAGRDPQIDRAVDEILRQLGRK